MGLYGDKEGRLSVLLPEAEITGKRDAWKAAFEKGYMPFRPDVMGFSITANGTMAGGGSMSLDFVMAQDGAGVGLTLAPNFGTPDASIGISFFMAEARPGVKPTVGEYLGGRGTATSIGLGPVSGGFAQSYDQTGRPTFNTFSMGIAPFTSRYVPSPFMGSYNTAPVTYGFPLIQLTTSKKD